MAWRIMYFWTSLVVVVEPDAHPVARLQAQGQEAGDGVGSAVVGGSWLVMATLPGVWGGWHGRPADAGRRPSIAAQAARPGFGHPAYCGLSRLVE